MIISRVYMMRMRRWLLPLLLRLLRRRLGMDGRMTSLRFRRLFDTYSGSSGSDHLLPSSLRPIHMPVVSPVQSLAFELLPGLALVPARVNAPMGHGRIGPSREHSSVFPTAVLGRGRRRAEGNRPDDVVSLRRRRVGRNGRVAPESLRWRPIAPAERGRTIPRRRPRQRLLTPAARRGRGRRLERRLGGGGIRRLGRCDADFVHIIECHRIQASSPSERRPRRRTFSVPGVLVLPSDIPAPANVVVAECRIVDIVGGAASALDFSGRRRR